MYTYPSGYAKHILSLLIAFVLFCSSVATYAAALEKVSLQLDWKYQFEFAGFIMAKEKGFYRDAGLDVDLIEYEAGIDTVEKVLAQTNNYGSYNSSVMINDGKLKPIVLLATYFQQSPLIFVTSKEIKTPNDLIGKTIMGTKDELKYSSLALLLNHFSITTKNAKFVEHSFNNEDFIQHKVDAMSAFRTNQLFELDQLNIEYNIIDPADFGFLMSAVNLFTSQDEALQHPKRTRKFIDASNQGWHYALAHPEETIAIIYEKYSQRKTITALRNEVAVTKKMMLLKFFDVGAINTDLSTRAVKQLHYSGLLPENQELGVFLFDELLLKKNHLVTFNEAQKLYLKNKKVITLCVDPNWMPLESIYNGQHIGIAADIISKLSSQLPIPIQLVETKSWQESLDKAKQRHCDILSLVSTTPERAVYMDFTTPHLTLPIVMATTTDKFFISDIADIRDQKFGIVKGYSMVENLRKKIPGINIVEVDSIHEGLKQVESGLLYGYIDNLMSTANEIQKDFGGTLKISSRLTKDLQLSIATRNDEPELHTIFNKLVQNISPEDKQSVYNKWVSVKQEIAFDYSLMWKIVSGLSLLSLGFIYHYYQLRKLNQRLTTLSITDKLTGLYNRVKIDDVLVERKTEVDRYKIDVAIILLDIDFFKRVNDTYGHIVGDSVLVEFANIIQNNVREADYVGRWGGEEFILISPYINLTEAVTLAEKLLHKVRTHSFQQIGTLTASAGVSCFSASLNIKETLYHVDQALYRSKQTGRDKVSALA
ncbi:diguanylate cyclase [Neptunomonas antarctica]|uniref:diguanylate cyclase n=1 Tax=Neptunomonas antarctica TaxID=619304 RepID=A0A1N7IWC0_9GAMM|nr:diguanylate cyclase [Neptunomonas antarctica]SIS41385.1 diguanylate cyclase (GGDEF) domain-containing protein [Neptunomonas antarctica]